MNYNLQRAINELKPTIFSTPYPRLSSSPAVTITRPGIGQSIKISSMIVPLRSSKIGNYELKKKVDESPMKDETIGSGNILLDRTPSQTTETEKSDEDLVSKSDLSDGLKYSFAHPKIEVGKIVFPKPLDQGQKRKISSSIKSETVKLPKLKTSSLNHKFKLY